LSPETPLLDQMLSHGFTLLGEEPGREIVFGTIGRFWNIRSGFQELVAPEDFFAFDRPDYGRAVMNFRVDPAGAEGGAVRLSTETRIFIPDEAARRKFARYWRVAGLGSALIRRGWLRAVKRRAER
jgi:hypothetical protein